MATLTIKNLPDDLYEQLKQRAEANRRSINSEVIYLIENVVRPYRQSSEQILAEAHRLREMASDLYLTEEMLNEAKNEGRP